MAHAQVDFTAAQYSRAKHLIAAPNDGPLTAFVLMTRATRLPDDCRNAAADVLFEVMAELGYLTPLADDIPACSCCGTSMRLSSQLSSGSHEYVADCDCDEPDCSLGEATPQY